MTTKRVVKRAPATAEKEKAEDARNVGVAASVQQYLEANPGGHVWASDIMTATGFPKKTVQNAIGYLRADPNLRARIVVIRPGNAWRWIPAKVDAPRIPASTGKAQPYAGVDSAIQIKVVGQWANGTLALDVNGEPYLARPA